MIAEDTMKDVLSPIGRNVEAVGRKLKSPRNDIQDLRDLQAALRISADTLDVAIKMIKKTQK